MQRETAGHCDAMSCGRAIDGDEPLFDFDSVDVLDSSDSTKLDLGASIVPAQLFDMSFIPQFAHLDLSSFSAASTPAEVVDFISRAQEHDTYSRSYLEDAESVETFKGKGRAVSSPMNILPRDNSAARFDLFSFNNTTMVGPSRQRYSSGLPSSSVSSPESPEYFAFSPTSEVRRGSAPTSYATHITTPGSSFSGEAQQLMSDAAQVSESVGKGKSRAEPPSLPPLLFSPSVFSQGETNWPIEVSSSPGIAESSQIQASPSVLDFPESSTPPPASGPSSPVPRQIPRPRAFSSSSTDSLGRLARRPVSRSKLSLLSSKRSGNLARKLLHREGHEYDSKYIVPANTPAPNVEHVLYYSLSAPTTPSVSRSFAIAEAYRDHVVAPEESSEQSHFELQLPKEMKLEIFKALLRLHEKDGKRLLKSSHWSALKAAEKQYRWIGIESGLVELVRLSRVCKSWQSVVFDGQLWHQLDLKAFPRLPSHLLLRLASSSGSFVRSIDLSGHTQLTTASLLETTKSLSIFNAEGSSSTTQLTAINLAGCSGLTSHALHELIAHSPLLVKLNVRGLSIVTKETCRMLAIHCPALSCLDVSRCHNLDANGVISFIAPYGEYRSVPSLKRLRLAGIRRAGDRLLSVLGRYAPNLEVLDLSGARELHNTALEAFVECTGDVDPSREILLTSREAGRDPGDPTKYRRRITKLRHLSLSYCPLLTDHACSHLAYALPKLEFLELAGIGSELKDEGLIRLLNTTPLIRRLDLDEACELTDATLSTLTPQSVDGDQSPASRPVPGSQLEVLNLSYAIQLTNDALLALIRNCTRLVHLELDSTRVNGTVVKEFVRLARKRQAVDAEIVVVDCRHVGDNAIKDLVGSTRTRQGYRAWEAQHLNYLDARDDEGLGVGTDECDEKRVALKSFYQWQTVDAVEVAREKRRKARKSKVEGEEDYFSSRRSASKSVSKWWSPGSRRASGSTSPVTWPGSDREREGCIIM